MGGGLTVSALLKVRTKGADRCGQVRASDRPHHPSFSVGGWGVRKGASDNFSRCGVRT